MTLITPLLGWFVIRTLGYNTVYLCRCTKLVDSSFIRLRDIIGGPKCTGSSAVAVEPARLTTSQQTAKVWNSHVTITIRLWVICHLVARIDIAYLCTKYDNFRFSRSSDMIGRPKFLMGHMTWPLPYHGRFVVYRLRLAHSTCTSNLKSLRSQITKMNKTMQNVESEVV